MTDYTIIGKSDCKWCDMAMKLMSEKRISYTYLSLEVHWGLRQFLQSLNLTTVPQVWRNKEHIGGYEDLHYHLHHRFPPERS